MADPKAPQPEAMNAPVQEQETARLAVAVELPAQDPSLSFMDQLKSRHTEEREAFFAQSRSEFRAVRRAAHHAVAEAMHEAWKDHFAEHRGDDAHARELGTIQRQKTEELQQGACEQLYEARNAAYQDLKQRQGEERHAMRALLAEAEPDREAIGALIATRHPAIDCASPILEAIENGNGDLQALIDRHPSGSESLLEELGVNVEEIAATLEPAGEAPDKKYGRDGLDLAAGGIGAALSAAADALGSIISPPPPHEQLIAELIAQYKADHEPERQAERERLDEERRINRQTTGIIREEEKGQETARPATPDWRDEERRR